MFHLSWIYVIQITPISHPTSHPHHIYTTPISHLHHSHLTPTSHYNHITSTSHSHPHPHHIHITSSYLHHPHLIYITSIIFSSTPHHIYITPTSHITPISHQDHIKITSTSLPYHTLHHIYTTPPHWHHHHAQSHLMQNDKGISSHPKELCCSPVHNDIIPLTLVANMDCQMHQARPYKDPSISSKMFQHHLFQCSTTST